MAPRGAGGAQLVAVRLALHGARVFATNWAGFALQFVTGVLVVRLLGAQGKGLLALVASAGMLLGMLGQFGFPSAALYLMQRERVSARALLGRQLLLAVAITGLAALLMVLWGDFFVERFLAGATDGKRLTWLALPLVPAHMIAAFAGVLLLARRESAHYARVTLLGSGATLLLTVTFVGLFRLGVLGAVLAVVCAQVVSATYGAYLLVRGPAGAAGGTTTAARLLRLGLPYYAGTVGAQTFKRLDNFLIGWFLGPAPVGYYSVALTAYDAVLSIPRALSGLVAGEGAKREPGAAATLVAGATRRATLLLVGVSAAGALLAWPLVPLVYGADFARAVPPLQLLLAAAVIVGWTVLVQTWFVSVGRMGVTGGLTLLAGIGNLLLSLWFIPIWGLVGSALATLLASVVTSFLHGLLFHRLSGRRAWTAVFARSDLRSNGSLKEYLLGGAEVGGSAKADGKGHEFGTSGG